MQSYALVRRQLQKVKGSHVLDLRDGCDLRTGLCATKCNAKLLDFTAWVALFRSLELPLQ